jgi:hypothetical protein
MPLSSFHTRRFTYFRIIWDLVHFYTFHSTIARVVRAAWIVKTRFCSSSKWFGPEKDTLGSEAPDEDTSIPRCGWNILLVKVKGMKNQCTASNVTRKDRPG